MVTMTTESEKGSTSAPKKNNAISPINEIAPNILVYKKVYTIETQMEQCFSKFKFPVFRCRWNRSSRRCKVKWAASPCAPSRRL